MLRIYLARFGPVVASVLAHVGVVTAIALAPGIAVRTPVLFAELVDPEPMLQPPPPRPVQVDRRPLRLPKLIEKPMPVAPPAPMSRPDPEPPTPEAPPPLAPTPAAPVAAAPPAPIAPAAPSSVTSGPPATDVVDRSSGVFASAPAPSPSTNGPASASSASPQATGPAVAALPTDGITQRAIPQGGYQHRPAYPSSARRLGVQGTTLLSVLVADDGRVANVVVTQSAGHPDLDQAAAEAVRRWRFEPARRGAEKVAMWVQLPVEFRLR
jgi:protein TonB